MPAYRMRIVELGVRQNRMRRPPCTLIALHLASELNAAVDALSRFEMRVGDRDPLENRRFFAVCTFAASTGTWRRQNAAEWM